MINFDVGKLANAAKEIQKEAASGDAGGLAKNVIHGLQNSENMGSLAEKATEQVVNLLKSLIKQAQGLVKSSPSNNDELDSCIKKGLGLLEKKEIDADAVTKLTAELSALIKKASPSEGEKPTKSAAAADKVNSTVTAAEFTDVNKDAYYYEAVQWAVKNGIASGTTATTFSPDNACTRAQTVTLIWRASGSPAPKKQDNPFTDVQNGAYYYDAVLWAVEKGITSGTTETTFNPDATVTRGQVATFIYRNAGSPAVSKTNTFTDVPDDAYYSKPVAWVAAKGVTSGTNANTFSPDKVCTRGQIVTFLYRAK